MSNSRIPLGSRVRIVAPPHNSRRGASGAKDFGKTGYVSRVGASSNGGWYSIRLEDVKSGERETVFYRAGALQHIDEDGLVLASSAAATAAVAAAAAANRRNSPLLSFGSPSHGASESDGDESTSMGSVAGMEERRMLSPPMSPTSTTHMSSRSRRGSAARRDSTSPESHTKNRSRYNRRNRALESSTFTCVVATPCHRRKPRSPCRSVPCYNNSVDSLVQCSISASRFDTPSVSTVLRNMMPTSFGLRTM
jgi:hypothetical protein